jgi:hypothetical protein
MPTHLLCLQNKSDTLSAWTDTLREGSQPLDVCMHYSIKQNYRNGSDKSHEALMYSLLELSQRGLRSVLLVSGGGDKRTYDTVAALQRSAAEPKMSRDLAHTDSTGSGSGAELELHVAFNPYFPKVLCSPG